MKQHLSLHITYGFLMVLTLLTVISANAKQGIIVLLAFATIKLLLVAFSFMELRKAHIFWKSTMVFTSLSLFAVLILMS